MELEEGEEWEGMGEIMARERRDWAGSLKLVVLLSEGGCGGCGGVGDGVCCFITKPGSVSEQMRLLEGGTEDGGGLDGGTGKVQSGDTTGGEDPTATGLLE